MLRETVSDREEGSDDLTWCLQKALKTRFQGVGHSCGWQNSGLAEPEPFLQPVSRSQVPRVPLGVRELLFPRQNSRNSSTLNGLTVAIGPLRPESTLATRRVRHEGRDSEFWNRLKEEKAMKGQQFFWKRKPFSNLAGFPGLTGAVGMT